MASPTGAFTVEFRVSLGACSRFTMQAFGSKGSRARIVPRRSQIDCVVSQLTATSLVASGF